MVWLGTPTSAHYVKEVLEANIGVGSPCSQVCLAWYGYPLYLCLMLITRVELFFLLISQNRSRNQRSGMILEVQIQSFGEHWLMRIKVSIFKKVPGGPKY